MSPGRSDPQSIRQGGDEIAKHALQELKSPTVPSRPLGKLGIVAGIAAIYFSAARLGLPFGIGEQVTPAWQPSGIALAAVVLCGYRVWPGVMLAAFLANLGVDEPRLTACGIAVGNTLEALLGA